MCQALDDSLYREHDASLLINEINLQQYCRLSIVIHSLTRFSFYLLFFSLCTDKKFIFNFSASMFFSSIFLFRALCVCACMCVLTCQSNCATPIVSLLFWLLLLVSIYIHIYRDRHISYHNLWWHAMLCALPLDANFLMLLLLPPTHNILRSAAASAVRLSIVAPINLMLSILWKFIVCCPPNLTLSCSLLALYGCMWKTVDNPACYHCCLNSKKIIQIRIEFDFLRQ